MLSKQPPEPAISLYEFYTEHTRVLQNVGYSRREAFWLHFGCLPFLPWDDRSENEIKLSQVFSLYASIYRDNIDGDVTVEDEPAFIKLLEERYRMVLDLTSTENTMQLALEVGRFVLPGQNDAEKCTYAGLIVFNTKDEWEQQRRRNTIPCKLIEDV
jgi:hypothetical protein